MSGERVLVVEDERIARENLEHVLRREGYRVEAVETGEEAADKAEIKRVLDGLKIGAAASLPDQIRVESSVGSMCLPGR